MAETRGRKRKEYIALNIKLAKDVAERLEDYSGESEKTKTEIVEEALNMYLGVVQREKRIIKDLIDRN